MWGNIKQGRGQGRDQGRDTAPLNRGQGRLIEKRILEQSLKQLREKGLQIFGAKATGKALGV